MLHISLSLSLLLAVGAVAQIEPQTCYYPSGTQTDVNAIPCNTTAGGFTHCCNAGDICISNAFCFGPAQAMVYRGGCTDPTFESDRCPQSCTDYRTDDFANVWKCPAPHDQDLFWCGDNSAKMCGDSDPNTFSWPNGREVLIAGQAAADTATNTTTNTTASDAIGDSSADSNRQDGMVSWVVALGTGLGVGVPLALATCVFAFLFMREKKLRRREREQVLSSVASSSAVAGAGVARGGLRGGAASTGTTREDRKLLGGNEVYEMHDANLQEMYVTPDAHEVKDPRQYPEQHWGQQEHPLTQHTPVSPLGSGQEPMLIDRKR